MWFFNADALMLRNSHMLTNGMLYLCAAGFSADTRTGGGQATADEDTEMNVREHAALLKEQNQENSD